MLILHAALDHSAMLRHAMLYQIKAVKSKKNKRNAEKVTTPKRKQRNYEAPHSTSPPQRVRWASWKTKLKQKDRTG